MATPIGSAILGLFQRLAELALNDPGIRKELRTIGRAIEEWAKEPESPHAQQPESVPQAESTPPKQNGKSAASAATEPPPTAAQIASLFQRPPTSSISVPEGPWSLHSASDADLPFIEARCKLKAEALRWVPERRRKLAAGEDVTEMHRGLIDRARMLPECFLWMCTPEMPEPPGPEWFELAAGCFETAAAAARMLYHWVQNSEPPPDLSLSVLEAAAEAQSALRTVVGRLNDWVDHDQQRLFSWLRGVTDERRIFLRRHMRLDDPAEPKTWPSRKDRIQELETRILGLRDRDKKRRNLFSGLKYQLKRMQEVPASDRSVHVRRIFELITELVEDGVPPSHPMLRDSLLPYVEDLLEISGEENGEGEPPQAVQLVLREIDRFLSQQPAAQPESEEASYLPEVHRVAQILRGRAVVLIGGERRPWAAEALQNAFQLRELVWVRGREHSSYTAFESDVAREDVALVILAIRWSSHGFGEVREYCGKYSKPLVRLPSGYNPNQVAIQILRQVGDQLAAAGSVSS